MPTNVRNGWQPAMGPTASPSSPFLKQQEPKLKNPAIHSSYCPKTSKLVPKHHPQPLHSTLAPNTNRQQPIFDATSSTPPLLVADPSPSPALIDCEKTANSTTN